MSLRSRTLYYCNISLYVNYLLSYLLTDSCLYMSPRVRVCVHAFMHLCERACLCPLALVYTSTGTVLHRHGPVCYISTTVPFTVSISCRSSLPPTSFFLPEIIFSKPVVLYRSLYCLQFLNQRRHIHFPSRFHVQSAATSYLVVQSQSCPFTLYVSPQK